MADGSVIKRCTCAPDGKRLGARCPKLRRGSGWNPHHGTWAYQLELLPTVDGKRRQLRRGGFDTREAAAGERDDARVLLDLAGGDYRQRLQIADLLAACKPGQPLPDRDTIGRRIRAGVPTNLRTTVAEYLTRWLTARTVLAPATRLSYREHIDKHFIPHLGEILLQELKTAHIQDMFTAIAARNARITTAKSSQDPAQRATMRGVRPMGAASQQRLRATLRKALNDAITREKILEFNPAIAVELDPGRAPKAKLWNAAAVNRWRKTRERPSPVMVWTPQQAGEFLDFAEDHDIILYPLFDMVIHCGLRRGEACGLGHDDVDVDAAAITISGQRTSVGYEVITKAVKSAAGERVVPMAHTTVAVQKDYLNRRRRWREVDKKGWTDCGLYFVRPDGTPWHPENVTERFDDLVAASGLPPIRFHDLRHCAATLMLAAGATLREIQETLGHANYSVTADIYTSVLQELQRSTAEATTALIPRRGNQAA